jgi:FkbM family methyltransferase
MNKSTVDISPNSIVTKQTLFKAGDLVFDVGANIGAKTGEFVASGARVVCFEPQPDCVIQLQQRFAQNPNVVIEATGLAAQSGTLELSICSAANTISTFSSAWKKGRFSDYQWDRKVLVPVTTLDAAIARHGIPAYVKVDVEGFELDVLRGLSSPLPLLSFEFTIEFLETNRDCARHLESIGFGKFNAKIGTLDNYISKRWLSAEELFVLLRSSSDTELWGDIYARSEAWSSKVLPSLSPSTINQLATRNLFIPGQPLRLHLGCGEQLFPGYVNIDYPADEHNVMKVKADYTADITQLDFPPQSVDEIRLHHVFEHFNRVTALAMLIKWQQWLKIGGKLHIETPDLMGSAEILTSNLPWHVKMGAVRHLAGDQAASWAYHVDHWFPERYHRTLSYLGFSDISTKTSRWPHEPYLCNVQAIGIKKHNLSCDQLLNAADELLWESTVAPAEKETHAVWTRQLRGVLKNVQCGLMSFHRTETESVPSLPTKDLVPPDPEKSHLPPSEFMNSESLPLVEIHDFNQRSRDRWVQAKAGTVPAAARVLDIGAGTCLYRPLFSHCDYKTHDFKKYEGAEKHGGTSTYGHIDFVSDILAIPAPDDSFDIILCTEVLEHVPEPIKVLKEISRLLRPGGRAFITAPLGSGLHQLPFHFYGGYTPEWYKRFCREAGMEATEIIPNGGFFKHLGQECNRAASIYGQNPKLHGPESADLIKLLVEILPRLFFDLDDKCFDERFTVGYFVEAVKMGNSIRAIH